MRRCFVLLALVLGAGIAGAPGTATADDEPAPLEVHLGLQGSTVTASFDATGAFTESFRKRLSGGLTSRVLIEVELFDGYGSSVAVSVRACQIRLDIWKDVLFVVVSDEQRSRGRTFVLTDEAIRACGRVERMPIAEQALLTRASGYRVRVRVALNPVSPEILERTREFIANPKGAEGRPRAFFAAVARLFRSEADSGGEQFVFQSARLPRPSKDGG